ncbi:hypothetical protein [Streptomyces sp. SID3343]|uniref:hypothetical protein n=1 Tax=Streptomyces sp. SID3343 TaxID=2690260 RepID=UPI00136CC729|nr:hypothetical protein [Streptomyces sp. SID3343]MYV99110.1 hypothetical protein [Streptomyces sp. SID3343]
MGFLRRRPPTGPDFDVLAIPFTDWPGSVIVAMLPGEDGSCQGIFVRYDLLANRGPAMLIGNLPLGSPAREEGVGRIEAQQLVAALGHDEMPEELSTEDTPIMLGDDLLIVRKIKYAEGRLACVEFDRSDNVLVRIVTWDRPITDDVFQLLKPIPSDAFSA